MNTLFIPIDRVLLETVFERGQQVRYALLQPEGGVSPLRVRFEELQRRLARRFSAELSPEVVTERIARMTGEQLLVTVNLARDGGERWDVSIRVKHPYESNVPTAQLDDARRSRRLRPAQRTDIKLELGRSSIEGTVYNVSEHGLGMALLTTALELGPFKLDEAVDVVGPDQRLRGRIRSQYPSAGGCVLGLELEQRLRIPGVPDVEA